MLANSCLTYTSWSCSIFWLLVPQLPALGGTWKFRVTSRIKSAWFWLGCPEGLSMFSLQRLAGRCVPWLWIIWRSRQEKWWSMVPILNASHEFWQVSFMGHHGNLTYPHHGPLCRYQLARFMTCVPWKAQKVYDATYVSAHVWTHVPDVLRSCERTGERVSERAGERVSVCLGLSQGIKVGVYL